MKYKPGDEVLVKGTITDLHEGTDHPYFVAVNYDSVHWVSEDKIIPMDKTYEMGLNDAWELAKKILDMKMDVAVEVFNSTRLFDVIDKFTPQEAFAKIEAYEKEKDIKVGDEVRNTVTSNTFWIIAKSEENLIGYPSSPEFHDFPVQRFPKNFDVLVKTGRTTDCIDLLRQIGE